MYENAAHAFYFISLLYHLVKKWFLVSEYVGAHTKKRHQRTDGVFLFCYSPHKNRCSPHFLTQFLQLVNYNLNLLQLFKTTLNKR